MAYKRWSESNWYVYWANSNANRKEEEKCAICYYGADNFSLYTYQELNQINSVNDLKKLLKLSISNEEYEECLQYVKQFLKDIEGGLK